MSWLYGQTWLWYLIAFVVGLALAWLLLVRPQMRRLQTAPAARAERGDAATGRTEAGGATRVGTVAAGAGVAGGVAALVASRDHRTPDDDATVAIARPAQETATTGIPVADDSPTETIPAVDPALSTLDSASMTHGAVDLSKSESAAPTEEFAAVPARVDDAPTEQVTRPVDAGAPAEQAAEASPSQDGHHGLGAAAGVAALGATAAAAAAVHRHDGEPAQDSARSDDGAPSDPTARIPVAGEPVPDATAPDAASQDFASDDTVAAPVVAAGSSAAVQDAAVQDPAAHDPAVQDPAADDTVSLAADPVPATGAVDSAPAASTEAPTETFPLADHAGSADGSLRPGDEDTTRLGAPALSTPESALPAAPAATGPDDMADGDVSTHPLPDTTATGEAPVTPATTTPVTGDDPVSSEASPAPTSAFTGGERAGAVALGAAGAAGLVAAVASHAPGHDEGDATSTELPDHGQATGETSTEPPAPVDGGFDASDRIGSEGAVPDGAPSDRTGPERISSDEAEADPAPSGSTTPAELLAPDAVTPDADAVTPNADAPNADAPNADASNADAPNADAPEADRPGATGEAGTPEAGTADAGAHGGGVSDAETLDSVAPAAGTEEAAVSSAAPSGVAGEPTSTPAEPHDADPASPTVDTGAADPSGKPGNGHVFVSEGVIAGGLGAAGLATLAATRRAEPAPVTTGTGTDDGVGPVEGASAPVADSGPAHAADTDTETDRAEFGPGGSAVGGARHAAGEPGDDASSSVHPGADTAAVASTVGQAAPHTDGDTQLSGTSPETPAAGTPAAGTPAAGTQAAGTPAAVASTAAAPGGAPYGPGSAHPAADGSSPGPDYTVKGNIDSMLYHTPESPYYVRTRAEAWFTTITTAEAAGFAPWNHRRKAAALQGLAPNAPTWTPGPYPGSATPSADGSSPSPEFTIKGNADSMLFHTPDSPYYSRTRAEAWFRNAADAEAAGFTAFIHR